MKNKNKTKKKKKKKKKKNQQKKNQTKKNKQQQLASIPSKWIVPVVKLKKTKKKVCDSMACLTWKVCYLNIHYHGRVKKYQE